MDYYYSSNQPMSSRGRFQSRGSSYRGSGRGESSYRGSRGYSSRGGYSTPRGRGSHYPKYETSSSKYASEGTRYASHTRIEDTSYRKPESSSYGSSREHTHHRSEIDIGRKRIRSDSYSQSQGGGSRRSHEVDDYRGSGSRYANANSYNESRSYNENRTVFKKPRLSEYKPKEEYRGRKEIPRPPVAVSKLRSIRGRQVRGRGLVRRGADTFRSRKRTAFSGSRTASELLARKARLLQLRRFHERAKMAKLAEKSKSEKSGDEDDTEGKVEKEDAGDDDKDTDGKKKDDDDVAEEEEEDDAVEGKEKEKTLKDEDRMDFFGKPFMKLQCPQCNTKCITFKEYVQHLYQATHVKAMKEKSTQLKASLAKMRIAQRAKQKKADEEDLESLSTRTIFCPICKLNYSQDKSTHQSSEAHKKMKAFLLPYCRICHIPFKGPMLYETHICSLDHIRRKNALDERLGKSKGSSLEYLDSYMVVDSVGSGDEGEDIKEEKDDSSPKKEKEEKKLEEHVNVGSEFVLKIEAYYCEVCRQFLPRHSDPEKMLRMHCRTKNHQRCYLKFGDDDLLLKIQPKDSKKDDKSKLAESEVKGESGERGDKDPKKENENHDESVDDEVGLEDKIWNDVGDLLSQVEAEPKSDDEDEEEGGRFDRFKSNEKKENGEVPSSEDALKDDEKQTLKVDSGAETKNAEVV